MDAFARAIAQSESQEANYERAIAAERNRSNNNPVVAGQFQSQASDGSYIFRTPGGGTRRAFSNTAAGFKTNAVTQLAQTSASTGFASSDYPAALQKEDVRGGKLLT